MPVRPPSRHEDFAVATFDALPCNVLNFGDVRGCHEGFSSVREKNGFPGHSTYASGVGFGSVYACL